MKTLLIDGNWNLKRNFHKRKGLKSNGELCGGVLGFLESLKSVLNKVLPDRTIVMWDGFNGGKLRYDIYKPYKANRNKDWEAEKNMIITDGSESEEDREKYEILKQKIRIREYLENLYVRQLEVDFIEADDLIASYILGKRSNEEVIIYSRDKDFMQLVSEDVAVLSPDNYTMITTKNFKDVFGYTHENELMFKCFNGDSSDKIEGVKGITEKTLIKYFPNIANQRYTYKSLVEECYEQKEKSKLKVYDKIIGCRSELYRNAELMNLKKPFMNEEALTGVYKLAYEEFNGNGDINKAMINFAKEGFTNIIGENLIDYFFSVFFTIMNKEKEYTQQLKNTIKTEQV